MSGTKPATASLWTAQEIAKLTGGKASADTEITSISIDSRSLESGAVFVALETDTGDGHAYVETAFENGAAAVLAHKDIKTDKPVIRVNDTQKALEQLGLAARNRCSALRLAVTGSAGKTGTKEMLNIVFSGFGKTHSSVKSYNNHWGVPLTLARMPKNTQYGVFEMGMNHAGEIAHLTKMVAPDIAIITTVLSAHIENFNSEVDIARAKGEIIEGMNASGILILNADNPHFDMLKKIGLAHGLTKIYGFGEEPEVDAHITDLKLAADGSKVKADILGEAVRFKLSIPGKHIALNALAVLTAVKAAGLDVQKAAQLLTAAEPIEGRGQKSEVVIKKGAPPITIIDESYNANPEAMKAAFKVLEMSQPKKSGRRIAVLGDMLELGPRGPQMHAELANPLLMAKTDLVFTCGPQMEALFSTLPENWRGAHEKDSFALCETVTQAIHPGDVVLVKGSLGSKMAYVVEALQNLRVSSSGQKQEVV